MTSILIRKMKISTTTMVGYRKIIVMILIASRRGMELFELDIRNSGPTRKTIGKTTLDILKMILSSDILHIIIRETNRRHYRESNVNNSEREIT